MSRKLARITQVFKRCQSTQAAAQINVDVAPTGATVRTASNGIITVSAEHDAPVARVAVVINAGTRYERDGQQGINHYLRALSSQATNRMTALGLTRSTQQIGASISCTSHREYLMYSVECLKEHIEEAIENLRLVSTTPAFKRWEVERITPSLKYDLALLANSPNIRCIEAVVEAAYKDTVGRSLYIREADIGRYKPDDLMEFIRTNFSEGQMSITAVGVPQDVFVEAAESFQTHPRQEETKKPSTYHGGEMRIHTGSSPLVYASIATQGVGYGNKDAYAAWILQGIMGTGPRLRWSEGTAVSRLGKAVEKLEHPPSNAISCIDMNYSDCGLFGFLVAAEPKNIGKVLETGFAEFASLAKGGITEEELERGKTQAKSGMYMCLEEGENKLLDMGDQALWNGQVLTSHDVAHNIDHVTLDDLNAFAKKVVMGRLSMSAVGDLTHTPYLHHFTEKK